MECILTAHMSSEYLTVRLSFVGSLTFICILFAMTTTVTELLDRLIEAQEI